MLKTRCIKITVLCLMCVSHSFAQYSGGTGSQSDPYLIDDLNGLITLKDSTINFTGKTNDKHFKLTNDIIIDNVSFIGGIGNNTHNFHGYFNGNKHKITHLGFSASIFGSTGIYGVIENLIMDGFISFDRSYISPIVLTNNGLVQNCHNYASVDITKENYAAGIVVSNRGVVQNCHNNAPITSAWGYCGGIVTQQLRGSVLHCSNSGDITASSYVWAGGIIASVSSNQGTGIFDINNFILDCQNTGSVKSFGNIAGGVVGFVSEYVSVKISNCINYGFVSGDDMIGGIAGIVLNNSAYTKIISNNSNFGVISGNSNVGCIIGLYSGTGSTSTVIIENNHYDKQMCGEEE